MLIAACKASPSFDGSSREQLSRAADAMYPFSAEEGHTVIKQGDEEDDVDLEAENAQPITIVSELENMRKKGMEMEQTMWGCASTSPAAKGSAAAAVPPHVPPGARQHV